MPNQISQSNKLTAYSPLAGLNHAPKCEYDGVSLEEILFPGLVRIQSTESIRNSFPQQALIEALACDLPTPGNITWADDLRIHWLTPNEWLVVTPQGQEEKLCLHLAHLPVYITEISDSRVTISVTGKKATALLSQVSALDLQDKSFPINSGTVTRFANISAMITRTHNMRFEITVDRAYAVYIWNWLKDAVNGLG
jgi:sarcosine oxidase subunit gamma